MHWHLVRPHADALPDRPPGRGAVYAPHTRTGYALPNSQTLNSASRDKTGTMQEPLPGQSASASFISA